MLPIIVAIFLALSVVGGGVVYASENAPPTSPLHPVQIAVNNTAASLHLAAPSSTATATPLASGKFSKKNKSATDTDQTDANGDAHPQVTLTQLPSPVASAVASMQTDIAKLTTDPQMPGQNGHGPENGLYAKLDAAAAALIRHDDQAAGSILNAFVHELNAMYQSGHMTQSDYDSLYTQYTNILTAAKLTVTPVATVTPHPNVAGTDVSQAHQNQNKHDSDETTNTTSNNVVPNAAPTPTPTVVVHGHANPNDGKGHSR